MFETALGGLGGGTSISPSSEADSGGTFQGGDFVNGDTLFAGPRAPRLAQSGLQRRGAGGVPVSVLIGAALIAGVILWKRR